MERIIIINMLVLVIKSYVKTVSQLKKLVLSYVITDNTK